MIGSSVQLKIVVYGCIQNALKNVMVVLFALFVELSFVKYIAEFDYCFIYTNMTYLKKYVCIVMYVSNAFLV